MTRDDIIRMAREVIPNSAAFELKGHYEIERFAALVAAYEREACARVCDGFNSAQAAAIAIRARGEKA
jgi:hypothetical protein